MDNDLKQLLNNAANGEQPQQSKPAKVEREDTTQNSGKKRETNCTITCSKDLRFRLKELALRKRVPMQTLLEEYLDKMLKEEGV